LLKLRGNRALRALDRSGSALLWAGGLVRRNQPLPSSIRRIGLLKTNAIGDTVLLSAVVRDLAAARLDAEVVLFVGPVNAAVAELIEGVPRLVLPLTSPARAIRLLRRQRLDVLLDFGAWPRINAIYAALSGARFTAGFETAGQARHYCFDATVRHSDEVHELENFRRLVHVIGVESTSEPLLRPTASADVPSAPYVVFHLWPGGLLSERKEWPEESWRELARRFIHNGHVVVLTGSPDDRARTEAFVASCNGLGGSIVNGAGRYGFPELVDLLAGARCTVSVNTGVMHLAAATGAPTVGLNGPTAERRWGPVGPRARSVNSSLPGCGYLDLGFEYDRGRPDCMLGISVDDVEATVREVVGD
jgi:heptosyltransferase III